MPTPRDRLANILARIAHRLSPAALASVSVRVTHDNTGWSSISDSYNERDAADIQQQYTDALTAWRKNPMAKRIIDISTEFCLGDGLEPVAPGVMGTFIKRFWHHPKNHMPQRLVDLSDELARAGDLFITLHRNPEDGLSYVRPIPKDRISRIETLPNDWETEVAYHELKTGAETKRWIAAGTPAAAEADAIMVHYSVNRVVGALLGESDLATLVPWLLRYSRMLEDRVRLNWAARAFLWVVTVPTNIVQGKAEQYNKPPESGSVIVKDTSEEWEPVAPNLHAFDAQYDLRAVRQMIDAGAATPPHWRGEPTDVNLATATAMERAATQHLRRRQLYLRHIAIDLSHLAYSRAWELHRVKRKPDASIIEAPTADLNKQNNKDLGQASLALSQAMAQLNESLPTTPPSLAERVIDLVFRFAGEPLAPEDIDHMLNEIPPPDEQGDPHAE